MRASVLSRGLVVAAALAMIGVLGIGAASASAASGAWWHLSSSSFPTQLQPGGTGLLVVSAVNRGFEPASGASLPIVLSDQLPSGVEVAAVEATNAPSFTGRVVLPLPVCSF